MSDQSFIVQIQETEEEAALLVKKAQSKQADELVSFEQELTEKRSENFGKSRDKARVGLKDHQAKAKDTYSKLMSDADKEAKKIQNGTDEKIPSAVNAAEHFLFELVG